eukprot:Protomagalhaensia_sp_Gyna_25__2023@NODE_2087_length_1298_cov_13_249404_g1724_i0_p1_GENE_NODE_2087_length_1298_cov_13_249404_g1724_i0NODE_2087_length_1298_cov_13_249404_g1724_i0_p1_ORF_typecomplete_len253_score38_75_NODE_2087_length_1298_cov_13_249404_g1724_i04571215
MSNEPNSHVVLMSTFIDSFFDVCRLDQQEENQSSPISQCEASKYQIESAWRRAVFLEDPVNALGHLDSLIQQGSTSLDQTAHGKGKSVVVGESDQAIKTAITAFTQIQSEFLPKAASLTHLKPISFISGKLPHLIDLKVLVVERLATEHYSAYSSSVADWTFFALADASGSVVAAFHPDLPKAVQRKLKLFTNAAKPKLTDLIKPGHICAFTAIKTISLFGATMVAFSTKSSVSILGTYMQRYTLDFGPRQG